MTDVVAGSAEAAGKAMADPGAMPDMEMPKNGYTKAPSVGRPVSSALKELMSVADGDEQPGTDTPVAPTAGPDGRGAGKEEAPAVSAGVVRAAHGDKQIEIPEDAVFKFKVEGKDVEVSYKDLQRNYQGKVPWEKRYKETKDLERQVKEQQTLSQAEVNKIKAERDGERKFVSDIMQMVQKDPFDALVRIAIKQGKNPVEFIPQYIQQAQKTIEHISSLDKNQFDLLLKQKKLDFDQEIFKETQTKKEVEEKQQKDLTELQSYVDKRIEQFKITQEEFDLSQQTLQKAIADGFDVSKLKPQQLADIIVGYVIQYHRPEGRIAAVAEKYSAELAKDTKFIQEVRHHISDAKGNILSEYSDDDIAQIVKGFIGSEDDTTDTPVSEEKPKEAVLGAKPAKDSSRNSPTPATFRKTPQKKVDTRTIVGDGDEEDPLSFDDILKKYKK